MALQISSTGARQLPPELANGPWVKHVETGPKNETIGEKAVFRGDIEKVRQEAQKSIDQGKVTPLRFDTAEISAEGQAAVNKKEAIDMTKPRKTSSIFAEKITRMEGESWEDFEKRFIEDWTAKYIEYRTKFNNGTLTEEERLPDAIESAVFLPEAVRREGETDEEFALKKLNRDTWNAWTAQWIKTATAAKHMPMGASLRYQDEQNAAWAADLMRDNPAMFREYLDLMVRPQVDHGNFDVAHVPPGFTIEDYNRWMSKDALEYLT